MDGVFNEKIKLCEKLDALSKTDSCLIDTIEELWICFLKRPFSIFNCILYTDRVYTDEVYICNLVDIVNRYLSLENKSDNCKDICRMGLLRLLLYVCFSLEKHQNKGIMNVDVFFDNVELFLTECPKDDSYVEILRVSIPDLRRVYRNNK